MPVNDVSGDHSQCARQYNVRPWDCVPQITWQSEDGLYPALVKWLRWLLYGRPRLYHRLHFPANTRHWTNNWTSVVDAGLTLNQQWFNISCLSSCHIMSDSQITGLTLTTGVLWGCTKRRGASIMNIHYDVTGLLSAVWKITLRSTCLGFLSCPRKRGVYS